MPFVVIFVSLFIKANVMMSDVFLPCDSAFIGLCYQKGRTYKMSAGFWILFSKGLEKL
jgi:hypothetical protein